MKTSFVVLAALAAIAFAGAAFAEEATKGSTTGPAAMTDSQMDAVTAGDPGKAHGPAYGGGTGSGLSNGHGQGAGQFDATTLVGKGRGAAQSALHPQ
jgi:hypothetical protein